MKALILSCNTGEGHNSAGAAIQKELIGRGHTCEIKNALELLPATISQLISKGHIYVYRHLPWLFGLGYKFEEDHSPKLINMECIKAADDMWNILKDEHYDAVICVHVFPALTLSEIMRRYHPSFRTYFVATDYTCSPGVGEVNLDSYLIPHPDLCDEFVSAGIPVDRLLPFGIPVGKEYYDYMDKNAAKDMLKLPQNKKIVLLSCGSMGCGPIEDLALTLKEQLPENAMLVAICGRNQAQYDALLPQAMEGRLRVVGFTNQMPVYMSAAELYLTKAGGLSTTEALVKQLPLVYINAVPGCETYNLTFCLSHGVAATARRVKGLTRLVCTFVNDEERIQRMKDQMKRVAPSHATQDICDYVINTAS